MGNSFFENLKQGLSKSRKTFSNSLDFMIYGEKEFSADTIEDLEEILITSDLGPVFTYDLIEEMKDRIKRNELNNPEAFKAILKHHMKEILKESDIPLHIPKDELFTIMVVGVNGTGKTTTIGKMASLFKEQNLSVMLVAADTFRAAAIEQLEIWSKRVEVPLIKNKMGSDPSSVVFDAIRSAKARGTNVMIVDTAGRLHTQTNLMEELKKIKRIMNRELPGAPHETLLILDSTTGQNAIMQAQTFNEGIDISGLVLTKLDGTSKGGIIIRITQEMHLPIRYIGIGEGLADLRPFNSDDFVDALLE